MTSNVLNDIENKENDGKTKEEKENDKLNSQVAQLASAVSVLNEKLTAAYQLIGDLRRQNIRLEKENEQLKQKRTIDSVSDSSDSNEPITKIIKCSEVDEKKQSSCIDCYNGALTTANEGDNDKQTNENPNNESNEER